MANFISGIQPTLACIVLVTGVIIAGCVHYFDIKEPPVGVTSQFTTAIPDSSMVSGYDWNRLKGNSGLYVFSYKFYAKNSPLIGKAKTLVREGIRVWEHQFLDADRDSFVTMTSFPVRRQPDGFFPVAVEDNLKIPCLYIRNHLVYGGRLILVAESPDPDSSETSQLDTLFSQFLAQNAANLIGVQVDTFKVRKR